MNGKIVPQSCIKLAAVCLFPIMAVHLSPAFAGENAPSNDELKAILLDLKQEQAALAEKIHNVEALLNGAASMPDKAEPATIITTTAPVSSSRPSTQKAQAQSSDSKLDISGDLQLRYEGNFSDNDAPSRNRGVMRARLRTDYKVNKTVTVGAEVSTGSSDDPNTVHVTLSEFVDDFDVSLSRLYARLDLGNGLSLTGGKFANPFTRTDLVWDGDVNPQGVTAIYTASLASNVAIKAAGIYSIIDEASSGPDSDMIGGQINFGFSPHADWRFNAAVSYYDYALDALASADAGDFRSNLRDGMGGYLSDFDLLNILASASYLGLGEKWPVTFTGDFVKNYGAAVSDDQGFSTHLAIGRAKSAGDWRFGYGYSQVEIDAVLAAFSNDNLSIATNYQSHLLGVDYMLFDQVVLNATLYHYKPLDAIYAGANDPDDWLDRLRLNMTIGF